MSEQNLNDILSGGGLSSLLQNPEVMAKLPRIMEALGPVISEMKAENAGGETAASTVKTDAEPQKEQPVLSFLPSPKKDSPSARRRALLMALAPYLSDNRREAMDYMGKVLSLIDILTEVI